MDAPKHLKHKPIISVNNYNNIDGIYAKNTDAKALSIGIAQYDASDISAKVWRYDEANKKWSRQSEELPLHRVLDLSILTIASLIKDSELNFSVSALRETCDNLDDVKKIQKYYNDNKTEIKARISELERLITEFRKTENKNYSKI